MEEYNTVDSKFRLAILAARRAKQIIKGSKRKIDMEAGNPLTIAMQEIKQGIITPENLYSFEQDELFMEEGENEAVEREVDDEDEDNDLEMDLESEDSSEEEED